jgi:excisionase family DNA binding protein
VTTGASKIQTGGQRLSDKRFMDVEELAAYLGISKWLVYKYVKNREIPFIPFGRLVRFDRLAVEKWAEKRMVRGFRARRAEARDPDLEMFEFTPPDEELELQLATETR